MKKAVCLCLILTVLFSCITSFAKEPEITSGSAILVDAETGQILFEKDKDKKVYPASITKVLTVYLAAKNLNPEDKVYGTHSAIDCVPKDSTNIAIDYDEELTAEQAMYAAMLMSANDACNVLAEKVSGSIEEFLKLMNTTAQSFGAKSSHFNNTNGLPDENHYTTASDYAKIAMNLVKDEKFMKYFSALEYTIPPTNKKTEARNFVAKHRLLRLDKYAYLGVKGGKTGYTEDALNTMVTYAEKDGKKFIVVLFGAKTLGVLNRETEAILNFGYNEFEKTTVSAEDLEPKTEDGFCYTPKGEASFYIKSGEPKEYVYSYTDDAVLISDKSGNLLSRLPLDKTEIVPGILLVILKTGLIIVPAVAVFIIFFIIRNKRKKKKKRKEQLKKRREEIMNGGKNE